MRLPPVVQSAVRERIATHGEPVDSEGRYQLVNSVLQEIVNKDASLFATPGHRLEMMDRQLVPENTGSVSKALKKSWFSYVPKRIRKKAEGEYLYTDERIAAFATANSVLCERPSIIVTSDYDYAAIFKQLFDNIIASASIRQDGDVDGGMFQTLVHSIEELGTKREIRQLEDAYQTGGAADSIAPKTGEVLVVIPRVQETLHYCFGQPLSRFVMDLEHQLRNDEPVAGQLASLHNRCNLKNVATGKLRTNYNAETSR